MFTVKLVVDGDGSGGHTTIHHAERVTVRRNSGWDVCSESGPTPHQFEIELEGESALGCRNVFHIGSDRFAHHQVAYVMNERGATVETIRASIPPKSLAA